MNYLSVNNFWKYQNADAWTKAKGHPPWFKHYVHRDRAIDHLSIAARLLWYELLAAATRYGNVLEADLKWICTETRMEAEEVAEALPVLIKGGWLSQTQSPRRSRKPSRKFPPNPLTLKEQQQTEKSKEETATNLETAEGQSEVQYEEQEIPNDTNGFAAGEQAPREARIREVVDALRTKTRGTLNVVEPLARALTGERFEAVVTAHSTRRRVDNDAGLLVTMLQEAIREGQAAAQPIVEEITETPETIGRIKWLKKYDSKGYEKAMAEWNSRQEPTR